MVPSIRAACLQPAAVLRGQWARLLWAPLLHADSLHLYYNMSSLLWKVRRNGSLQLVRKCPLHLSCLALCAPIYLLTGGRSWSRAWAPCPSCTLQLLHSQCQHFAHPPPTSLHFAGCSAGAAPGHPALSAPGVRARPHLPDALYRTGPAAAPPAGTRRGLGAAALVRRGLFGRALWAQGDSACDLFDCWCPSLGPRCALLGINHNWGQPNFCRVLDSTAASSACRWC